MQKFLSGKRYKLLPSGGQIGKGQGSQRVFRIQDLYRIATANLLVRAGFPADFVRRVLRFIEDEDLISFGRAAPDVLPPRRPLRTFPSARYSQDQESWATPKENGRPTLVAAFRS